MSNTDIGTNGAGRPAQPLRLALRGQSPEKVQQAIDAHPEAVALDASACNLTVCVFFFPFFFLLSHFTTP